MEHIFRGSGVALVTPFKSSDLSVDFDALENLIELQIGGGTDFIAALGTTGEPATMSTEERHEVYRFILDRVKGRVPIMVGMGGNNTRELVNHIKSADLKKVDAILSVVPFYNKPSQEGIYRHFMAVAEASPVPVVLYNVPSRCGVNLMPETALRLFNDSKKFIGIKEASGNLEQIKYLIDNVHGDRAVISGDDSLIYDICNMGGHGVISVMANVFPSRTAEVAHKSLSKSSDAFDSQKACSEIVKLLFAEGSPAGAKAFLSVLQIAENVLRLPLCPVSDALYEKIKMSIK